MREFFKQLWAFIVFAFLVLVLVYFFAGVVEHVMIYDPEPPTTHKEK